MSSMGTPQGRAHFHKNVHGRPHRAKNPTYPPYSSSQNSSSQSFRGIQFPVAFKKKSVVEGRANQVAVKDVAELSMEELLERARQEREAHLPIYKVKNEILHQIKNSNAIIITAETGAGKSTQVPQMLIDAGYTVVLTQPRRLAAFSVAGRIAEERGSELGEEIGFKHAFDQSVSSNTKLVVTTDGYTLLSQLHSKKAPPDILIIDEFHERNQSMDTLIALYRKAWSERDQSGGDPQSIKIPRLVIMSATLDAEGISKKLGGAPIVHATGRSYPIETRERGESMLEDVRDLVEQEKNVLVFLPGKAEIRTFKERLELEGLNAEIFPLHSQLPLEEQQKSMKIYSKPKIVLATNIAETSITIADIDAVVDSGLERDMMLHRGVETLSIHPISQFNLEQRKGRCGRCGPGVYIYHGDEPIDRLQKVPTPEVQRVPLGELILTLNVASREIEQLPYLDAPSAEHIEYGRKKLRLLGLLSPQGRVTKDGAKVAELPVGVSDGAMVVHAQNLTRERRELAPVLELAIDIAAINAVEGIIIPDKRKLWSRYTNEKQSDPISQLQVLHASEMQEPSRHSKMGIDTLSLQRLQEYRNLLTERLELGERPQELPDLVKRLSEEISPAQSRTDSYIQKVRDGLLESILKSQMDSVFVLVEREDNMTQYKNLGGSGIRRLAKGSVIESSQYIVGRPFDLLVMKGSGDAVTIPLVLMATEVSPDLVKKFGAPELKREIIEQIKRWTKHFRLKETGEKRPGRPSKSWGRKRR